MLAQICPKLDLVLKMKKTNDGIGISISHYSVCPFSGKTDNFELFVPKTGLRLEIQKTNVNKNHHPRDSICASFQAKWTTSTFLAKICQEMDLGLDTQKINVGIRISILEILRVSIFRQNGQF